MFCGKGEDLLILLALLNTAILDEMNQEYEYGNDLSKSRYPMVDIVILTNVFHSITYWCSFMSFILSAVTFILHLQFDVKCIHVKLVALYSCISIFTFLTTFSLNREINTPVLNEDELRVPTISDERRIYLAYKIPYYCIVFSGFCSVLFLLFKYRTEHITNTQNRERLTQESTPKVKRIKIQSKRSRGDRGII